MFIPNSIYYEKNILEYTLGKELFDKYKKKEIKFIEIENHNNIEELRSKENREFVNLKRNLIIGIRKTHKFVPNYKVSNYLVPYTSSGCTAMCLYCYLVCNYNKCSYLRLFVNREEMLDKIKSVANKEKNDLIFEIGSNSDLVLENTITNNLVWTIKEFKNNPKGLLTFPTKFDMVDPILPLEHKGKIIARMSVNPKEIIKTIEIGTSPLDKRVEAINKLAEAEYKVGILIAPVILVKNWKIQYENLLKFLENNLTEKVKKKVFFEIIFMTYSYVHRMINSEAFPTLINLYNQDIMTGRGKGKYCYRTDIRKEAEKEILELMHKYFPYNEIKYVS